MYDKTGSLDVGKIADFLITSGPIFGEKTLIYQNWVQGNKYTLKDEGWKDIRGTYNLIVNSETYKLELKGEAGKPIATIISTDTAKADLTIQDRLVKLNFAFKKDSTNTTRLSGVISDDKWSGTGQSSNGKWIAWSAIKTEGMPDRRMGDRRMNRRVC